MFSFGSTSMISGLARTGRGPDIKTARRAASSPIDARSAAAAEAAEAPEAPEAATAPGWRPAWRPSAPPARGSSRPASPVSRCCAARCWPPWTRPGPPGWPRSPTPAGPSNTAARTGSAPRAAVPGDGPFYLPNGPCRVPAVTPARRPVASTSPQFSGPGFGPAQPAELTRETRLPLTRLHVHNGGCQRDPEYGEGSRARTSRVID
jgi:hypothetical protein